jgi:hypothetical protein
MKRSRTWNALGAATVLAIFLSPVLSHASTGEESDTGSVVSEAGSCDVSKCTTGQCCKNMELGSLTKKTDEQDTQDQLSWVYKNQKPKGHSKAIREDGHG